MVQVKPPSFAKRELCCRRSPSVMGYIIVLGHHHVNSEMSHHHFKFFSSIFRLHCSPHYSSFPYCNDIYIYIYMLLILPSRMSFTFPLMSPEKTTENLSFCVSFAGKTNTLPISVPFQLPKSIEVSSC